MPKFSVPKLVYFLLPLCICLSCKKGILSGGTTAEQLFENNVLNRNFVVTYATDNGVDITTQYNGYTFFLLKTDFYHGPLQATKNSVLVTGSWSSNEDYSKLVISLPDTPSEFVFLNRPWRFTSKGVPLLKLAPWGSSDPVVLHMLRQ